MWYPARTAALAAGALAACRPSEPPARPPAVVNGEAITADELEGEVHRALLARGPDAPALATEAERSELRRIVLTRLVEERLVEQTARAREVSVGGEEVEREVQAQRDGFSSAADWRAFLTESGLEERGIRLRTRARLEAARLLASEVSARVALGADDARLYFEAHREEFQEPEQVRCAQILLRTQEDAKAARARLQRGEAFEKVTAELSRSPDGKQGGELGTFARGTMPEAFDETCFALARGQVSQPVVSPYGVHLFKLLDRRGKRDLSFEAARPRIERMLRTEKESDARAAYLQRLRAQAKIEVNE